MNIQHLNGMLGLAVRARQAAAGTDACRILVRTGQCGVLLVDGAAGPNARKKAEQLCGRSAIPVITLPEGAIEAATGRSCMVMAVRKGSFADRIIRDAGEHGDGVPGEKEP